MFASPRPWGPRDSPNASITLGILGRELGRARWGFSKRVFLEDMTCSDEGVYPLVFPDTGQSIPFCLKFSTVAADGHLVAVATEGGSVCLIHTLTPASLDASLPDSRTQWDAAQNAVFDLCWAKDDHLLATASGDKMCRIWDVETQTQVAMLSGHTGSVKSIDGKKEESAIWASGGRDGCFMIWDTRALQRTNSDTGEPCYRPVRKHERAHVPVSETIHQSPASTLRRRGIGAENIGTERSVTCVMWLRDPNVLATTGATDGRVKFWDVRNSIRPMHEIALPCVENGRRRGITSLTHDSTCTTLAVSCTDSRIYLYDYIRPDQPPVARLGGGHENISFFIKSAFSPDDRYIVSGSRSNAVYIYEVDSPADPPIVLRGHTQEVSVVDWCQTDFSQIASCSDDCTVRVWNIFRTGQTRKDATTCPRQRRSREEDEEEVVERMETPQRRPRITRYQGMLEDFGWRPCISSSSDEEDVPKATRTPDDSDAFLDVGEGGEGEGEGEGNDTDEQRLFVLRFQGRESHHPTALDAPPLQAKRNLETSFPCE